jgi:hypothetical protein
VRNNSAEELAANRALLPVRRRPLVNAQLCVWQTWQWEITVGARVNGRVQPDGSCSNDFSGVRTM